MTGGRTVILGPTGRNFAAGMSGGIAYVWDMSGEFRNNAKCNLAMVDLETIELDKEITELRRLIELHRQYTGSTVADKILNSWNSNIPRFVKVMPIDYKRVLTQNTYGKNRDSIVNPKGSAMEYPKAMKTNQRPSRS
jgi:glutamate synthase domain-containing protein 3